MLNEPLGGQGQGVLILHADTDVAVKGPGQLAGHQRIHAALQHQLLHDADAQAAGHHGQNGLILLHCVLDVGLDMQGVEHLLYLVVVALVQQDHRILLQRLRREGIAARQRMVTGNDHLPLIPL